MRDFAESALKLARGKFHSLSMPRLRACKIANILEASYSSTRHPLTSPISFYQQLILQLFSSGASLPVWLHQKGHTASVVRTRCPRGRAENCPVQAALTSSGNLGARKLPDYTVLTFMCNYPAEALFVVLRTAARLLEFGCKRAFSFVFVGERRQCLWRRSPHHANARSISSGGHLPSGELHMGEPRKCTWA